MPAGPRLGVHAAATENPLSSATDDVDAWNRFNGETRDEAWAQRREGFLRPRLVRLSDVLGHGERVRVDCRSTCCQIDFGEERSPVGDELQTSAGIPLGTGSFVFMSDRVITCFEPGVPYPPEGFVDRLDERIALDRVFRAAEVRCRSAEGAPGFLEVGISIDPKGEFKLELKGDLLGTSAAGCVEDSLYEQLKFTPAKARSYLDVRLRLEAP